MDLNDAAIFCKAQSEIEQDICLYGVVVGHHDEALATNRSICLEIPEESDYRDSCYSFLGMCDVVSEKYYKGCLTLNKIRG